MNKKITAIIIAACVAIFTFFLGGAFLIYNSFIKTQELQAKVKIEQEKTKQEMLKTQNDQQMAQVTTSQETSAPVVAKKGTNYEGELMSRMSSVQDTGFDGSDSQMYYQAEAAYQAWDKELNKVYKLLMSELPDSQKTKLRNEERAWLKGMVNETKKIVYEECGEEGENGCGSIVHLRKIGTKMDMVKSRTIELARMYDDLHR
ncbi:lysozyme inhibitor LprI family protein [Leptotrichia buccalis]|jgi:hypothetical protein|uniref:Lysozyme inhibitor LprI-like N-terminal domain-containing protein n=1 Tax=Leptotrichia buccalis (strain ATCC 14201 / DSM 1135 / JCM 12969 / NCTC 10249 / C-1013-b) TaxID=523794 RepID=C7NDV6_LEPBD|nr:lysozyme inhibitor LprI family protein [Leptotrichia buccalis]ACV40070.1 protein of unknown function DUF1311 [Leptotrichia buccalis C-1013-b]